MKLNSKASCNEERAISDIIITNEKLNGKMAKTTTTYSGEGRVGAQSFDGDGVTHYIMPDFQGNTAMDIADPINHIDPSGMKWENASDSTYLHDELNALLNNCENIKSNKVNKLIESKLSTKKRNKIQSEIDALNIRIDYIKRSINCVKQLGDDTNMYKLMNTKGVRCYVKCENKKVIIVVFNRKTMPLPVSCISEIDSDYISRIGGRFQLYDFTE